MANGFNLFESILWTPEQGYFLLDRHLARLERSAEHLGFRVDLAEVDARLAQFASELQRPRKVRLIVAGDGELSIQEEDLKPSSPVRLAIANEPVDRSNPFLQHKTSRREVYERALAAHPEAQDVVLWNQQREITETCTANLVLEIDGGRLTPMESAGLLPGTFRAQLLDDGEIEETCLTVDDLHHADKIYLINSVRRWCDAHLIESR
ncbi:aminotransferase class IV family protein [Myxococcota bacterium]|nr:aminotransferase class IV family protein [Myxococcota bacterium]